MREGTRKEVSEKVLEGRKGCIQIVSWLTFDTDTIQRWVQSMQRGINIWDTGLTIKNMKCKKKLNGRKIQSWGSFSMNQILLALCKHMSNLALHAFQIYFKSNVILIDRLFMTPELLQKNNWALQEFTLSSYTWPLWEEREQISMNIWQLLKEQNLLLSPCIQHKNFNYSIPLYSHPPLNDTVKSLNSIFNSEHYVFPIKTT